MQHKLSALDGSIYILELAEPFERLELQEMPSEISGQRSGNYAEINVPGRNDSLFHFTGGSESFSISCQFFADDSGVDNVLRDVNWLLGLMANDSFNAPVRKVSFVFGKIFDRKAYIVKDVKYKFMDFRKDNGLVSRRAEVTISFALAVDNNRSIADIRQF
ncbi:hypothetical protein ACE193_21545 [Bernardetia sp. OM2101]|uniref:hypothetical protein n=1 Tax=Bernardetia sp. OM2101 TaxID=3344876 RepID=UPI0035CF680A